MNYEFFLKVALARGVGDVAIRRILRFFSENQDVSWESLCSDISLQKLIFYNKQEIVDGIATQSEPAKRLASELEKNSIKIVFCSDDFYPKKLRQVLREKCPPYLFYKGNIGLTNRNAVGFCGSRNASPKGIAITQECSNQFAKNNIIVVSGYAKGIDIIAHSSALMNSGETVFVLAEGILMSTVKREVHDLLNCDNHVFLSQFMPESSWNAGSAMKRNSVIIGLSDAMIIVESGKSGGTFAAGKETLSLNHPLFVIDFAQPEVSAEANPYFISKGGIPIRGKNGKPNLSEVYSLIGKQNLYNNYFDTVQLQLNVS